MNRWLFAFLLLLAGFAIGLFVGAYAATLRDNRQLLSNPNWHYEERGVRR